MVEEMRDEGVSTPSVDRGANESREKKHSLDCLLGIVGKSDELTQQALRELTDDELKELYAKVDYTFAPDFGDYNTEYEYASLPILTTNPALYDQEKREMCCGIVGEEFDIRNKKFFFAFSYGH